MQTILSNASILSSVLSSGQALTQHPENMSAIFDINKPLQIVFICTAIVKLLLTMYNIHWMTESISNIHTWAWRNKYKSTECWRGMIALLSCSVSGWSDAHYPVDWDWRSSAMGRCHENILYADCCLGTLVAITTPTIGVSKMKLWWKSYFLQKYKVQVNTSS